MGLYLVFVAPDRPDLFQHLRERHGGELQVILGEPPHRRMANAPIRRGATAWQAPMERQGLVLTPAAMRDHDGTSSGPFGETTESLVWASRKLRTASQRLAACARETVKRSRRLCEATCALLGQDGGAKISARPVTAGEASRQLSPSRFLAPSPATDPSFRRLGPG